MWRQAVCLRRSNIKKCPSCNLTEPEIKFYANYYVCNKCHYQRTKAWRNKNLKKRQDYEYRRAYGITLADVEALAEKQKNKCAICHRSLELFVDHDHKTGIVRGLLCRKCNLGIGYLEEKPEFMLSAIQYLRSE